MRENELGCCGYDELAYKPPTTKPLRLGIRAAVMTPSIRTSPYRISNLGQHVSPRLDLYEPTPLGPPPWEQGPKLEPWMPFGAFPVPWGRSF